MTRAFTLLEVMTVAAITAILAGLVFTFSAPAREQARQGACASNLHELYMAESLYAADYLPDGGLGDQLRFPDSGALLPYVKSRDVFYCPDSTPRMKEMFWTTYHIENLPNEGDVSGPATPSYRNHILQLLDAQGGSMTILTCEIHDETFYEPREPEGDSAFGQGMFELRVKLDGSLVKGWFPDPRRHVYEQ